MSRVIKQKNNLPETAVIAITERCNSRCSFCSIWCTKTPIDLNINLIDQLPLSLKNVNITGGEPLLHKNFDSIIEKLIERNCKKIIINTNGLVDLKKYERLWMIKNIGIRFSLDGIEKKHDSLRGIEGNYERVLMQIEYLKSIGFYNIGVSSTFSDTNIDQAVDLYMLSRKQKVDFTCMVVNNSEIYYKKSDNVLKDTNQFMNTIKIIIKEEMKTFSARKWGKVSYMNEMLEFIRGNIKSLKCSAGTNFFFMQPTGEIYACNMRGLFMGNLTNESFENIWFSDKSNNIRETTYNCTKPCWTMCNAKSIMFDNKFKYFVKFCRNFIANFND